MKFFVKYLEKIMNLIIYIKFSLVICSTINAKEKFKNIKRITIRSK